MTQSLADRITRSPRPHDPAHAAALAARFSDLPAPACDLIAATGSCSGYLGLLAERETEWLREAVATAPEDAFEALLAEIRAEENPSALSDTLRRAKRRGALLIALADLGGVWQLGEVTDALTRLADTAVHTALIRLVATEIERGKLPGCTAEDAADGAGLFALAMGKMGAGELNYSSDIDLVMLFDETRHDPELYGEVRRSFIRVTQRLVKLLSERTGEGYVFRTDLRLRPDPSSTPVVIAAEAAEQYYESLGRTWERAAYIKARPCGGDRAAGGEFLSRLRPFIWRRHLDYAAIEDAYDMLVRIRSHKGLAGPIEVPGHNLKLGRGGIREIEFFTQTRQLILGGRNPQLRDRRTLHALAALAAEGWVEKSTAETLTRAYVDFRTIEHRLQMLDDAQTHRMPTTREGLERLACFAGAPDCESFQSELLGTLETVHALTEPFFAPEAPPEAPAPSVWEVFSDPERARGIMSDWQRLPALRTSRARGIFRRLEPELLRRMAKAHDADEALRSLDAFLARIPAGVQLFSLMEANPPLLDLLVDICGTTPELARYLGSNPGVLDAVINPDFFGPLETSRTLFLDITGALEGAEDYETVLNRARIWMKEHHFRIGVHLLRGLSEPDEAAAAYSAVAEAVLDAILPHVVDHFAERHGRPPGRGAAVLAMGKFGSREMTVSSDLDLIVIYDADDGDSSEGRRPLSASAYYARLTQAVISALTAPMTDGILYKVDMRLRPSGRQGPVATSLTAFRKYQESEAWTWEHLALTRARLVAGRQELRRRVEAAVREILARPHDPEKTLADARDMRRRLAEANEKEAAFPWATKHGPGRMMDIELLAQTGVLVHGLTGLRRPQRMLDRLVKLGWIGKEDGARLGRSLDRLAALQQVARLASDRPIDPEEGGEGYTQLLLRVTGGQDIESLREDLAAEAAACDAIITARLAKA
ncbi:bifunctional [glutamine synthetase] adenylyltransferase/[glutamine synthetase]-adenylyl-L-tyrosine phosphorylase [Rhodobacteraceae bacterium DSL-40]|uniref:bifunctional [glutamine synthetase] adenylyltransferase/[glutamine synthetase]-adenylyl-L-tyrosine phosphorylase n=1 Tax=Amaricoccus sp. B4 TaxID=3368557 RepID=UPI000DAC47B3